MDFLDPLYHKRHITRLYIGYVLVAIAIFLAAAMLILIAKGYQLTKDGQVTQNGLVFASSKPVGAKLYLDGIASDKQTNTRVNVAEGSYELELKRDGYRSWQHRVQVLGGSITRYDYPLLFPETLTTTTVQTLATSAPGVVTQTPNRRFMLVQQNPAAPSFLVFDLQNITAGPTVVTIPTSSYAAGGTQTWQLVAWANDNVHVLLKHGYGNKLSEYVLLSRTKPAETVNVSALLKLQIDRLTFIDGKFDRYYLYSTKDQLLRSATLKQPTPVTVAEKVLAYDSYKDDTVLYVTPGATTGQVAVHIKEGSQDVVLQQMPKASQYQIVLSEYSNALYVAVADPSKQAVYVYKNPMARLLIGSVAAPVASLKLAAPTYLSFSFGGRFVVAERGAQFVAYDAEYKRIASYHMPQPIDKGQTHAVWLDGAHLQYVSNKQLYFFDYDGTNAQLLVPAVVTAPVAMYDNDFRFVYTVAPPTAKNKTYLLTSTALRTTADQ